MANLLISGYYGFGNLGDEVILAALLRAIGRAAPESRITVLSACPRETEGLHGVSAVDRAAPVKVLRAVRDCDLLLSGGGSLLQDRTSSRSLWYYLSLLALAQSMGKATMVISQGVGPLTRPLNRRLTCHMLEKADAVTLRDRESRQELEALGLRRPTIVTADPVLALPIPPGGGAANQLAWVVHGRCCTPALLEVLARSIRELNAAGCTSWLLPFHPREDGPALERLTPWARLVPPDRVWDRLGRCGTVISMRLHGLILGARLGARLLSLSCDPKTDHFLRSLGLPPGLRPEALTEAELTQAILGRIGETPPAIGAELDSAARRLTENERLLREILINPS